MANGIIWLIVLLVFSYFFTMGTKPNRLIAENVVKKWKDIALPLSVEYSVPVDVILGVVCIESAGNPDARNDEVLKGNPSDDSMGLMQIRITGALADYNRVHKSKHTAVDLVNPYFNLRVGTWFLAYAQKHYVKPSTLENAIMYFNGGGSYGSSTTKNYLSKVLGYRELVLKIMQGE